MNVQGKLITILILAIVLIVGGVVQFKRYENKIELNDIKYEKAIELLNSEYVWKSKRLRLYTDLIYRNK